MKCASLTLFAAAIFLVSGAADAAPNPAVKPNIVIILADDLGYGDVKAFNPEGKIATPNIDRLATEGMAFTDAHSSSAVCTPTRYSILTGRYNWRSRLKRGVLGGFSTRLIEENRLTLPAFLRQQGYATACIGKWHLGMNWPLKNGGFAKGYNDGTNVDYAKPIQNGPNSVGFDYYYGISASLDMPPFVFIENDRVTALPTAIKKWVRSGPAAESFEAVDVLPTITTKAVDYIAQHTAAAKQGKPFFLYFALTSPHTPILPGPEWKGKSGLNNYGDFVMATDAAMGRVLAALDKEGLRENTLVILTSDNGCSPAANFPELLAKGHNPSYVFRGYKADIFDGGHRIPFIARWPKHISAGATNDQLICLVDLFRTCADVLTANLPDTAAEDSVSLLPAFESRAKTPLREAVIHHSINGSFSVRQGNWKLEICPDSGGWSDPKPGSAAAKELPPIQLYDLSHDINERHNVQADHPEIVRDLTRLLEKYIADGRSTPGAHQANTSKVSIQPGGAGGGEAE